MFYLSQIKLGCAKIPITFVQRGVDLASFCHFYLMNSVLFLFFFRLKFNISYYCESKFSSNHSLTIHLQRAISAQRKGSGRSRVGSGQPERRAEGKKNTTEFTTRMYFLNIFLSSFLEIITFEIFLSEQNIYSAPKTRFLWHS